MKCFSIFRFETSLFLVHISKFLESIDQILFNVDMLCNNELMLSSFHKFISIFNVNLLISIVDILSSDAELLLLLSFAILFAKRDEEECIKRLFIFLFIASFFEFQTLNFQKIHLTLLKYFFNLLFRAFHVNSNFSVKISQFLF